MAKVRDTGRQSAVRGDKGDSYTPPPQRFGSVASFLSFLIPIFGPIINFLSQVQSMEPKEAEAKRAYFTEKMEEIEKLLEEYVSLTGDEEGVAPATEMVRRASEELSASNPEFDTEVERQRQVSAELAAKSVAVGTEDDMAASVTTASTDIRSPRSLDGGLQAEFEDLKARFATKTDLAVLFEKVMAAARASGTVDTAVVAPRTSALKHSSSAPVLGGMHAEAYDMDEEFDTPRGMRHSHSAAAVLESGRGRVGKAFAMLGAQVDDLEEQLEQARDHLRRVALENNELTKVIDALHAQEDSLNAQLAKVRQAHADLMVSSKEENARALVEQQLEHKATMEALEARLTKEAGAATEAALEALRLQNSEQLQASLEDALAGQLQKFKAVQERMQQTHRVEVAAIEKALGEARAAQEELIVSTEERLKVQAAEHEAALEKALKGAGAERDEAVELLRKQFEEEQRADAKRAADAQDKIAAQVAQLQEQLDSVQRDAKEALAEEKARNEQAEADLRAAELQAREEMEQRLRAEAEKVRLAEIAALKEEHDLAMAGLRSDLEKAQKAAQEAREAVSAASKQARDEASEEAMKATLLAATRIAEAEEALDEKIQAAVEAALQKQEADHIAAVRQIREAMQLAETAVQGDLAAARKAQEVLEARTTAQLEEQAAGHKKALEEALNAAGDEHAAQVQQLRVQQEDELSAARQAAAKEQTAMAAQVSKLQEQLEAAQQEAARKLEAETLRHKKAEEALRATLEKDAVAEEARVAKLLAEKEIECERRLLKAQQERAASELSLQRKADEVRVAAIKALKEEHKAALQQVRDDARLAIGGAQTEASEAAARRVAEVEAQQQDEIEVAVAKALESQAETHAAELKLIQQKLETAETTVAVDLDAAQKELRELKVKSAAQIAKKAQERDEAVQAALVEANGEHTAEVEKLKHEQEEALRLAKEAAAKEQAALAEQVANLDRDLQAAREKAQEDLAAERARHTKLEAELKAAASTEHSELAARLQAEAAQAKKEAVEAALEAERAKLQQRFESSADEAAAQWKAQLEAAEKATTEIRERLDAAEKRAAEAVRLQQENARKTAKILEEKEAAHKHAMEKAGSLNEGVLRRKDEQHAREMKAIQEDGARKQAALAKQVEQAQVALAEQRAQAERDLFKAQQELQARMEREAEERRADLERALQDAKNSLTAKTIKHKDAVADVKRLRQINEAAKEKERKSAARIAQLQAELSTAERNYKGWLVAEQKKYAAQLKEEKDSLTGASEAQVQLRLVQLEKEYLERVNAAEKEAEEARAQIKESMASVNARAHGEIAEAKHQQAQVQKQLDEALAKESAMATEIAKERARHESIITAMEREQARLEVENARLKAELAAATSVVMQPSRPVAKSKGPSRPTVYGKGNPGHITARSDASMEDVEALDTDRTDASLGELESGDLVASPPKSKARPQAVPSLRLNRLKEDGAGASKEEEDEAVVRASSKRTLQHSPAKKNLHHGDEELARVKGSARLVSHRTNTGTSPQRKRRMSVVQTGDLEAVAAMSGPVGFTTLHKLTVSGSGEGKGMLPRLSRPGDAGVKPQEGDLSVSAALRAMRVSRSAKTLVALTSEHKTPGSGALGTQRSDDEIENVDITTTPRIVDGTYSLSGGSAAVSAWGTPTNGSPKHTSRRHGGKTTAAEDAAVLQAQQERAERLARRGSRRRSFFGSPRVAVADYGVKSDVEVVQKRSSTVSTARSAREAPQEEFDRRQATVPGSTVDWRVKVQSGNGGPVTPRDGYGEDLMAEAVVLASKHLKGKRSHRSIVAGNGDVVGMGVY